MAKLSTIVEVRTSDPNVTESDVKFASQKITGWKKSGYSTMAMMHYLSDYFSVGGYRENGVFVLNISK